MLARNTSARSLSPLVNTPYSSSYRYPQSRLPQQQLMQQNPYLQQAVPQAQPAISPAASPSRYPYGNSRLPTQFQRPSAGSYQSALPSYGRLGLPNNPYLTQRANLAPLQSPYAPNLQNQTLGLTPGLGATSALGLTPGLGAGQYAQEVQILRNAVVNPGTNEDAIIGVIARTNSTERAMIRNLYTQTYGENLLTRLNNETSGHFNTCVVGAFMTPAEFDAYCLYKAMKGLGTNEGVLSEIIGSRTPLELQQIKQAYQMNYGESLEKAVEGDTSGDYRNLLLALLACRRSTNPLADNVGCQQDANVLYQAGEGKWGTDEDTFIRVFATRSSAELMLINQYYKAKTGKGLLSAIDSEFSGDMKELLNTVIRAQVDAPEFYADRIHESLAGAGTNDSRLIRNVISRNEKDMPLIMNTYRQKYGSDLVKDVNSDTSGDYRKVLNAILLGYSRQGTFGNYGTGLGVNQLGLGGLGGLGTNLYSPVVPTGIPAGSVYALGGGLRKYRAPSLDQPKYNNYRRVMF